MAETISIDIGILQGIFTDLTKLQTQISGVAGVAGTLDATLGTATNGMRDSLGGVTSAVNSVEAATDSAMRGMVNDIMGPIGKSRELEQKLQDLGNKMRTSRSVSEISALKKEIAATQRELDRVNTGGMESKVSGAAGRMRGMLRGLVAPVASAFAIGGITSFIGSVAKAAGETQAFEGSLKALLQSKEKADALGQQVKDFAAKTPFSGEEVQKATTQFVGYGFAAKDVIPTMSALGDVAAGLNLPFADLAEAYGRLREGGKLDSMSLKTFQRQGIPIVKELAAVLGVSKSKVTDLVTEGKVGFGDLEQAFKNMTSEGGLFFGQLKAKSDTITGMISNLGDDWNDFKSKVGLALAPQITKVLGALSGGIERLGRGLEWIQENGQVIKDVIAGLAVTTAAYGSILLWNNKALIYNNALKALSAIRDGAMALWTGLTTTAVSGATAAQWSWNAALLANPIGLVIAAIAALVAGVVWAWNRFEGFRAFLYGFWEATKEVFKGIGDALAPLVGIVAGFGKTLVGAFTLNPALIAEGIAQGTKAVAEAKQAWSKPVAMNVAVAYVKGDAKGRASFRADQKEKGTTNAKEAEPGSNVGADTLLGGARPGADDAGGKGSTVSGKGSGDRNIAMNITMNMQFGIGRDVQQSARDTAEQVVGMITNKLRDAQFALR